ncbi:MAG: hemolysin family protein [Gammaproteobacteria bacterium]|uniref:hemolysin family protein n=1 Tax=Rhodoferax sp. TaxID=50421 RepID=UPI0018081ACC|nr:hemolysin family protein [Rhodoferax sp.]MBU3899821.1 hemolysin family protein [Gammaproteobacteria bacterium]MBA3059834.1 HlyC/CorC family transporter [Rhodoferax sp.]MBU3998852.1 hemolysin family protein [Gammaproteobacteria bacterium]MBU4019085.1 hemolysin family protein [Gammaproteobacteria bacterium]MBU4078804.1 hemolysin family protein [Gammaproteobacteria bacterium]
MEIAILFALILLNGAFAMSEIALVTARKARLQKLVDEGDSSAIAAVKLGEDPTRFLSTIQIGITSIGVLNGIVGEAALAPPLAQWLLTLGLYEPYASYAATGLVVVLITYFSIVLGELVPKRLGQSHPETVARLVAKPINLLAIATKPFVRLLSGSTKGLLRLLGVKESFGSIVTEAEIHAVLAEGTSAGVIESHEHTMVRNVFLLDDRQLSSLMVPRGDVVFLDINKPFVENLRLIDSSDHARFPVVKDNLDNILGIVNARQLLSKIAHGEIPDLQVNLQAPLYVPETLTGMELLDNFRLSDVHMAFVIDEYGQVQGIVTLKDLIEAITGEFQPRDPETSWAVQREDGSWLLDGYIPVPELKDRLGLTSVPEEERGRYHTLSGMMMLLTGRLPKVADTTEWQGWKFEIVDMDGKTIDKVLASSLSTDSITTDSEATAG